MATNQNTITRNNKVKEEYKILRADRIKTRDEVEKILAAKFKRSTGTIRDIISRKDYPTKKTTKTI